MTWLLEGIHKADFSYFHVGPIFFPLSTTIKHYRYTEESLLLTQQEACAAYDNSKTGEMSPKTI